MDIKDNFTNESNEYRGHGIGSYSEEKIKSIFNNGLRCSHNALDFTTLPLGQGSETLFEENKPLMDNWQHKNSKQIIIVSVPIKYKILDIMGTGLYKQEHAAFYNTISREEADKLQVATGRYVKPEFVMGMYNAETEQFISNDKYYENLPENEQEIIMDEVKKQYIDTIKEAGYTLEEYSEILDSLGWENPLSQEMIVEEKQAPEENIELANDTIMVRGNEINPTGIAALINPELLNKKIQLPTGAVISANQYIQEVVAPEIPKDGNFTLKNGVTISAVQYIEEVLLSEIENYGGNITELLENTTIGNNGTIEIKESKLQQKEQEQQELQHEEQLITETEKLINMQKGRDAKEQSQSYQR